VKAPGFPQEIKRAVHPPSHRPKKRAGKIPVLFFSA
jgi:hypothetical protein